MKRITVKALVDVPCVPNFLLYEGGKLSIADVSDGELRYIGSAWTEELILRAQALRAANTEEPTPE